MPQASELFLYTPMSPLSLWLIATTGALTLALLSYRFRLLSGSGAIGAAVVGTAIAGGGSLEWAAPLLLFFASGSLLSRLAPRNRFEEKGARRDAMQVLANGGVAAIAGILHAITGSHLWSVAALGSLAAAAADTWATEIGGTVRGRTFSLTTFRPVEPGRSGGVSIAGTLGGAIGGGAIAASGAAVGMIEWSMVPLIALAGTLGMIVDSIAGASLQYLGVCPHCGRTVESRAHCGVHSQRLRGARWITNDAVNIICTVTGALIACLLASR